jgi:hypothetical protein
MPWTHSPADTFVSEALPCLQGGLRGALVSPDSSLWLRAPRILAVEGPVCTLVGWAALTQLISMLGASVAIAYSTYRLVTHHPLTDRQIALMIAGTWVVSGLVGVAFVGDGIVGNFKDIYCCVAAKDYKAWAVGSTLAFIIGAATATAYLYVLAFRHLAAMEGTGAIQSTAIDKVSSIIMRRGCLFVGLIYFWWVPEVVVGDDDRIVAHGYSYHLHTL